ncbi:variant erythrocyte surface antigen-1 family protein [Babesia divergens]|uniref:Variant erythrocyte surface antigen-1 family protein n=1 Tax=Babesia divergens TaxID=32595 RepID=A0AAD9GM44_BABDI|nr:variant erythrocyte surface antigen-1 family protein [Babesia divergens]
MDSNGKPKSALAKFLFAWGFTKNDLNDTLDAPQISELLNPLFPSGSSKALEKLYDASLEYFSKQHSDPTSTSFPSFPSHSDSQDPLTVRQMLLWLYGLRFTSGFSSLVLYCSALCLPFGNSFNSDAFCYYLHVSCFLLPVSVISFIETSESTVTKFFSSADSEFSKFSYPEDLFKLFDMLLDFVRKIYIPLNFLKFQCERVPVQAGWQSCYFGKSCQTTGKFSSGCSCPHSKIYLCTASASNPHDHCAQTGSSQGCLNATSKSCSDSNPSKVHTSSKAKGQPCKPCPHPLQRFLIDGSSVPPSKDSPSLFQPAEGFPRMGFKNLSSTAKSGYDLSAALHVFCKDGFYPLTRLLEFCLFVSRIPPATLLELFVFFMKFKDSSVFKEHFSEYVDGEPGSYSGRMLQTALQRLFASHFGSHPYDLKSLHDCEGPRGSSNPTCGQYLYPLYNADSVFNRDFLGIYLSIVCHLAENLKRELESFYKEAKENFKCCISTSTGSPCPSIVSCPCALPFFYNNGFSFYSPSTLNGGKKCSDFVDQIEKVVEGNILTDLLKVIDNFLWSIRLPFVYAFLYIWILVISYFYYVQFYKLDLLHIDSHLHLPRSFKILPSTLFSDASSKLKDLSYFTL